VLAHETALGAIDAARDVLDRFGVANRLRHIAEYVWRGGTLRLEVEDENSRPLCVSYELLAHWPAPIFEPLASPTQALVPAESPVLEGRWVSGRAGYVLRIGLDLRVPSTIFIRSDRPLSNVPFLHRSTARVESALAADLAAYVEWFLDTCEPVPRAVQAAAQRLRQYGLDAWPPAPGHAR
jgi:hypothetical protein